MIQAPLGRFRSPAQRVPPFPQTIRACPFGLILWVVAFFLCGNAALAVVPAAPPANKPSPTKSLVLITVEGLRPDYLSCYKKGRGKPTPRIDQLAAESRLFEQVVAPSVSSLPSLATLLTGKTPFQHQVWDDGYRNRLSEKELTLAEQLKAKGYRTGAFLGTSRAATGRGFDQGFDIYQDGYVRSETGAWNLTLRTSRSVMAGASSWLQGVGDGPFFLWLHFSDPIVPGHGTAEQPATELERTYLDRLALLDEQIGVLLGLLKERKDYEDLTVALTADHGFGLEEHGEPRAGVFLYEGTLRVPLILRTPAPNRAMGSRVAQLSGLIDLYPTLVRLLEIPATPGISGRDLLGQTPASLQSYHATALFGRETFGWAASEVLAQGKWRLIFGPRTELYDIVADPGETKDLSSAFPNEVSRLRGALQETSQGESVPRAHFQTGPAPSDVVRTRLKQMGMTQPTLENALVRALPDPGKFRDSLLLLEEMVLRSEVIGNPALSKLAEPLLKADPQSRFTLLGVGAIDITAGEDGVKRAQDLLKTAQQIYPLEAEVYHQLGHLAFPRKRLGDAIFFLKTALELQPVYQGEVVYDLACAYARSGDKVEALKRLREAVGLGFRDSKYIGSDPDLESLRGEAGFKKLMKEIPQAPPKP